MLEQHRFELRGFIYMHIFFSEYTGKFFGDSQKFENTFFVL